MKAEIVRAVIGGRAITSGGAARIPIGNASIYPGKMVFVQGGKIFGWIKQPQSIKNTPYGDIMFLIQTTAEYQAEDGAAYRMVTVDTNAMSATALDVVMPDGYFDLHTNAVADYIVSMYDGSTLQTIAGELLSPPMTSNADGDGPYEINNYDGLQFVWVEYDAGMDPVTGKAAKWDGESWEGTKSTIPPDIGTLDRAIAACPTIADCYDYWDDNSIVYPVLPGYYSPYATNRWYGAGSLCSVGSEVYRANVDTQGVSPPHARWDYVGKQYYVWGTQIRVGGTDLDPIFVDIGLTAGGSAEGDSDERIIYDISQQSNEDLVMESTHAAHAVRELNIVVDGVDRGRNTVDGGRVATTTGTCAGEQCISVGGVSKRQMTNSEVFMTHSQVTALYYVGSLDDTGSTLVGVTYQGVRAGCSDLQASGDETWGNSGWPKFLGDYHADDERKWYDGDSVAITYAEGLLVEAEGYSYYADRLPVWTDGTKTVYLDMADKSIKLNDVALLTGAESVLTRGSVKK